MLTYCDAHLAGDDHPGWDAPYPYTAGHIRDTPSTGHVLQFAHLLPPAHRAGGEQEVRVADSAAIVGVNVGGAQWGAAQVHVQIEGGAILLSKAEVEDCTCMNICNKHFEGSCELLSLNLILMLTNC